MTQNASLGQLAKMAGIALHYRDVWERDTTAPPETLRAMLAAIGLPADGEDAIQASTTALKERYWRHPLEPVYILPEGATDHSLAFVVPEADRANPLAWQVEQENGEVFEGSVLPQDLPLRESLCVDGIALERRSFLLSQALPAGYHRLRFPDMDATAPLIVAPVRCHLPDAVRDNGRVWGVAVQLYGLRSERNWGIGDFSDLQTLTVGAAGLGADAVGLSPVHALFPTAPQKFGPYSPSSRTFLNVLLIDVEAVAEFTEAQAAVTQPDFQRTLAELRATELVDYRRVAACKLAVLEHLFAAFRYAAADRRKAFEQFVDRGGPKLESLSIFEALSEHFGLSWTEWPIEYQDPESPAVVRFADDRSDRVDFFRYLQWQAEAQLAAAANRCRASGMALGLYGDLAVGVDRAGAEVWSNPTLFAIGVATGAPPDSFNPVGQNWGFPPMNPLTLRDQAYAPLIATLRANMRHFGALRIDHILGLMRLFWIPEGKSPRDGAYMYYPLDEILAVVRLESVRNRCLVVGEDLGTLPEGFRDRLRESAILSYRLLYFERKADATFVPPSDYPELALVAVSTHDLPTLAGFWHGHDLDVREQLDLWPSPESLAEARSDRARDMRLLVAALTKEELLPDDFPETGKLSEDEYRTLAAAAYDFLARSPSRLLMVQFEDLLGLLDQANVPGTTDEHPNWRRKLPHDIDTLLAVPQVREIAGILSATRRPAPRRQGT